MATIHRLVDANELIQLGGGLEDWEHPVREMYAFPHVIEWLENVLPRLKPEMAEARSHELCGIQSPMEQVDDLIHDFISGGDMDVYERSHCMEPNGAWVWELKTIDVRFFGWFYKRGVFIIANADSTVRCKTYGLYTGYRDDTERRRNNLEIDGPKLQSGGYDHVL